MVSYLELVVIFMKIGFIMFGGGYGGIGIYYKILVEEKKWISEEEFLAIIGVAESTPGPIAINAATWIGYVLKGIPGSLLATISVIIPSYIVILTIVVLLRPYMDHWVVKVLFRGVNVAVLVIILYALFRLADGVLVKENKLDYVAISILTTLMVLMTTLRPHPVLLIAIAALMSLGLKLLFNL